MILSNYICIKDSKEIKIYNINDYKLDNNLVLKSYNSSIEKYTDNILIMFFTSNSSNNIILYDLSNIKNIKKCILSIKHIKGGVCRIYTLNNFNILEITRDITGNYVYILEMNNLDFNLV